jgi:lysophospholipase L1-like esterase
MITIVALGDSTTAGTPGFLSPLEAPPHGRGDERSQYAWWLMQAHPDWVVLNRGVDGERSDQIAARFDRDVVAASPAAVIIIAGVNDIYQGREAEPVMGELERLYERARAKQIPVIAGSIVPYNTAGAGENARMRAVNNWICGYAALHDGITFCDTRAAVAAPGGEDVLVDSPDKLHPSVEGYRRMAKVLEASLVETLCKAKRKR